MRAAQRCFVVREVRVERLDVQRAACETTTRHAPEKRTLRHDEIGCVSDAGAEGARITFDLDHCGMPASGFLAWNGVLVPFQDGRAFTSRHGSPSPRALGGSNRRWTRDGIITAETGAFVSRDARGTLLGFTPLSAKSGREPLVHGMPYPLVERVSAAMELFLRQSLRERRMSLG